jgi:hypothetical protein
MNVAKAIELLKEDSWFYIRNDGNLQLWRKFNLFVYLNEKEGTFSNIFIGDPKPLK